MLALGSCHPDDDFYTRAEACCTITFQHKRACDLTDSFPNFLVCSSQRDAPLKSRYFSPLHLLLSSVK